MKTTRQQLGSQHYAAAFLLVTDDDWESPLWAFFAVLAQCTPAYRGYLWAALRAGSL